MHTLIVSIIAADLAQSTERVAIRLLARTAHHGHLCLSWSEYCQICNRTNHNSARRHLTALAKAGLIRYHAAAGSDITISWLALLGTTGLLDPAGLLEPADPIEQADPAAPPAVSVAPRATLATSDDAPPCHPQRAHAPQADPHRAAECAPSHAVGGAPASPAAPPRALESAPARQSSHTRVIGGGGGYRSSIPERDDNTTTNHSERVNQRLLQLGLRPKTVKVETSLTDGEIHRILDDWQRDASDNLVGAGALFFRLANGVTPPDLDRLQENTRLNKYIPEEYRDIIIGYAEESPP